MSKHTSLTLTPEQRQQLDTFIRTGHSAARQQTRARILLLLDRSQERRYTDAEIAAVLNCHPLTVGNIRRRFLQEGLDAVLTDKPMGCTTPKKVTGEVEARIVLLACSNPPDGHARWTLRLLADKAVELGYVDRISHVSVGETLKKTRFSPGACRLGASPSLRRST